MTLKIRSYFIWFYVDSYSQTRYFVISLQTSSLAYKLRSQCETHEDWCLWYQGLALQNAHCRWRNQSTGPGSDEANELAFWVVKWQGCS